MSALGAILVKMAMKALGYEFVCKVLIASAEEWSAHTETKWDDKVTAALKEAL